MTVNDVKKIWEQYFSDNPHKKDNHNLNVLYNKVILALNDEEKYIYSLDEPNYPEWVLNEISKLENINFDESLVGNPSCSKETLFRVYENMLKSFKNSASQKRAIYYFRVLADNRSTPVELFYKLHELNINEVNQMLTENPFLPKDIFEKFYASEDVNTLASVAKSPRTPPSVLNNIFNSRKFKNISIEEYIYIQLASNLNTPSHMLRDMVNLFSASKSDSVHQHIALNPNVDEDILLKILPKTNYRVRTQAARTTFHPSVLNLLKTDPNYEVRISVLTNPVTPKKVYIELLNDQHVKVRKSCVNFLFPKNFFGDWPREWVEAQYGITS